MMYSYDTCFFTANGRQLPGNKKNAIPKMHFNRIGLQLICSPIIQKQYKDINASLHHYIRLFV
ncbi:hypothetical protein D3C80_1913900 [compost metagenome]